MRKILKRNIQKQRQQRSVTYMRSEQQRQQREKLHNAIGGLVMGLVIGVGGFYAADHALEKRLDAIGVSVNVEKSK